MGQISKKKLKDQLEQYEAMYANILDVINTDSHKDSVKPVSAQEKLDLIKNVLLKEISPF